MGIDHGKERDGYSFSQVLILISFWGFFFFRILLLKCQVRLSNISPVMNSETGLP